MTKRYVKTGGDNFEVAPINQADALVVARRLASDPDGLDATGSDAPHEESALRRVIESAINQGTRIWRVRVGDDLFGAIVGDDPFTNDEKRLFVWLDPRHRGDDLGIKLVAETIRHLEREGRETVVVKPPRSNYAALRILNVLEFTYLGESENDGDAGERKALFERRTGQTNPERRHPDIAS